MHVHLEAEPLQTFLGQKTEAEKTVYGGKSTNEEQFRSGLYRHLVNGIERNLLKLAVATEELCAIQESQARARGSRAPQHYSICALHKELKRFENSSTQLSCERILS